MPELDRDVVIVGASAAGLHAARRLAQAGVRVLVLEQATELGVPTRTLIVTQELQRVLGLRPDEAILHCISRMQILSDRAQAEVELGEPDWVIDRARMNRLVARLATEAGAEIWLGTRINELEFESGKVRLTAETRPAGQPDSGEGVKAELRAHSVIGADGLRSTVAASGRLGRTRTTEILQAVVRLPQGHDPDQVRIWFDPKLTDFFLWLIPQSERKGVLGLVAEQGRPTRALLDEFAHRVGLVPLTYQGAVIPLHSPGRILERNLRGARILLVGDAAGHVKVTTVGGLVSGLRSAEAAASSILRGTPLSEELRALDRELQVHDLIRWVLGHFSDSDYDLLLAGLNDRTHAWLHRGNRDSISGDVLGLLLGQPSLALLGIRALLRPGVSLGTRPERLVAGRESA